MSGESLLVILIVGLIAGWLAGQIVRGTGFGLVADICIGRRLAIAETGHSSWTWHHRRDHLGHDRRHRASVDSLADQSTR